MAWSGWGSQVTRAGTSATVETAPTASASTVQQGGPPSAVNGPELLMLGQIYSQSYRAAWGGRT